MFSLMTMGVIRNKHSSIKICICEYARISSPYRILYIAAEYRYLLIPNDLHQVQEIVHYFFPALNCNMRTFV